MFRFLLFATLACAVAVATFPSTRQELESGVDRDMRSMYKRFTAQYSKEFSEERYKVFSSRMAHIFEWNEQKSGTHSYSKGVNFFTDMTLQERESSGRTMGETKADPGRKGGLTGQGHGGLVPNGHIPGQKPSMVPRQKMIANAGDVTSCDLRQFQTAVKDQGACGSCYAFGTLAAAEGSHFLWANVDHMGIKGVSNNLQMSEQVLIECCNNTPFEDGGFDSNGCGGGGVQGPAECVTTMGAVPSNVGHPYVSGETATTDNSTCSYHRSSGAGFVDAWFMPCDSGDETCLQNLIGGNDCVMFYSTAIKTSIQVIDSFRDYTSGVYSDPECPNDKHNHAVAIVGFGTDATSGMDYWIVRNSWGNAWGDGGYIKMQKGVNLCCISCENLIFQ